jgi:hypothetical protein
MHQLFDAVPRQKSQERPRGAEIENPFTKRGRGLHGRTRQARQKGKADYRAQIPIYAGAERSHCQQQRDCYPETRSRGASAMERVWPLVVDETRTNHVHCHCPTLRMSPLDDADLNYSALATERKVALKHMGCSYICENTL